MEEQDKAREPPSLLHKNLSHPSRHTSSLALASTDLILYLFSCFTVTTVLERFYTPIKEICSSLISLAHLEIRSGRSYN